MSDEPASSGLAQLREHNRELGQVRAGLQDWLRHRLEDSRLTVGPLGSPGGTGVANETLLFDVHRSSDSTVGYVARLAAPEALYLDYDLATHYRMYEAMMGAPTVPTPAVVGFEPDAEVLGAPFFVMEKIDGVVPSDKPSWASEGFVVDAEPAQRRWMWERTVALLAEVHRLDSTPFGFLRTGVTEDGVGDCLHYWMRFLRWAAPDRPVPLTEAAEEWLVANRPSGTALSWGDSRLPNVIYRRFEPVGLLDWDLVSLAGPQADVAWWIIMTPPESLRLDGIGSHDQFVNLWEDLTGSTASQLRWFLVFSAYRLAAVIAKLMSLFVAQGRIPSEAADRQLTTGLHAQLLAGLLELRPPAGVVPVVPDVGLDG